MGVSWTKEQQQVIDLRNRNLLVSAAAGSGKTAVLVERIITRLTKDEPPLNVDELLIVTFTEAAAAEMKERIRDAIEKKLSEQPENVHLERQAALIHNAAITTIHSFCLSVIRSHFHAIDLDPGFRIAEEGELKLLKHDVLSEVLEEAYEEAGERFLSFVESFSTGRDDKKIEELVLKLYEFSRSYENPEKWLRSCLASYQIETEREMEESPYIRKALEEVREILGDCKERLANGVRICQEPDGPFANEEILRADLVSVEYMLEQIDYKGVSRGVQTHSWPALSRKRMPEADPDKKEAVKNIRNEVKDIIEGMKKQYFYEAMEEQLLDMQMASYNMEALIDITIRFSDCFAKKKRDKNIIDFSDMEQFALHILTEEKDGVLVPSAAAREYQSQFKEVMIDEYQDSNYIQEAILTSVSTISQGKYNVFMVGDVKQSIYRFRLARPELFMEKFHRYSLRDSEEQRIDLSKNFRSRREVLDSTNFIFSQIMRPELGEIDYDEKAALYVGAAYETMPGNETEVLLVDTEISETSEVYGDESVETEQNTEAEESVRELEARAIAGRIKELVGNHPVLDKKTGTYRPARYEDIVILTRSIKGWMDVFTEVLMREGVPTFGSSQEGYFQTREIGVLLDYLRILDNPRQDIPLTSVLTSPLCGLSNEELARIRSEKKDVSFYEAVSAYAESGTDEELKTKMTAFFEVLNGFRKKVPYTAIHELLWQVMEETGYREYISALPGGEQRAANLEMLVEKAVAFESTSYKGLFHFVRYMEQLEKYEVDYGEANILDEHANTVRIMSIHKSKGLEFPIVFVAGMSKRFNKEDTKGSIVLHPTLGIGVDAVDLEKRTKTGTLLKRVIQRQTTLENLGEELRVLYVALTRAKEKLIMVGTVNKLEKKVKSYGDVMKQDARPISFLGLTKAMSYYDWVLQSLVRHKSFAPILEEYNIEVPAENKLYLADVPIEVRHVYMEEIAKEEIEEAVELAFTRDGLENWNTDATYHPQMREQIEEQFAFCYPYEKEQKYKLKFTVSELKKRRELSEEAGEVVYEEVPQTPLVPKFMEEEEELKGASRGSAYHKFLELLDFKEACGYGYEELQKKVAQFVEEERMSREMGDCIHINDMRAFLATDIAGRMARADKENKLFAEQPFVLGVPMSEVYPEDEGEETALIQGIIDVYFEEDGELVVLDYKTDRVRVGAELVEKYHKQLEYYGEALERLTGKTVKEKLIYSFALREVISL